MLKGTKCKQNSTQNELHQNCFKKETRQNKILKTGQQSQSKS